MKENTKRILSGAGFGLLATVSLLAVWPVLMTQSGTLLYAAAVLLCLWKGVAAAAIPIAAVLAMAAFAGSPLCAIAVFVLIVPPVAAGVYTAKQPVPVERGVLGLAFITFVCFIGAFGILWLDAGGDPITAAFQSMGAQILGMGIEQQQYILDMFSAAGLVAANESASFAEQMRQALPLLEESARNGIFAGVMSNALSAGGYMAVFGAVYLRRRGEPSLKLPELSALRFRTGMLLGLGACVILLYFVAADMQSLFGGPSQAVWRVLQWVLAVQGAAFLDSMMKRGRASNARRYTMEAIAFFVVPTVATIFGALDALANPRRAGGKPEQKGED